MVLVKRITAVIKSPLGRSEQGQSGSRRCVCVGVSLFSKEALMNTSACCKIDSTVLELFFFCFCFCIQTPASLKLFTTLISAGKQMKRPASGFPLHLWGSFCSPRLRLRDNPEMLLECMWRAARGDQSGEEINTYMVVFFFSRAWQG